MTDRSYKFAIIKEEDIIYRLRKRTIMRKKKEIHSYKKRRFGVQPSGLLRQLLEAKIKHAEREKEQHTWKYFGKKKEIYILTSIYRLLLLFFSRSSRQEGRRLRWSNLWDYSGFRRRATFRATKKRAHKKIIPRRCQKLRTNALTHIVQFRICSFILYLGSRGVLLCCGDRNRQNNKQRILLYFRNLIKTDFSDLKNLLGKISKICHTGREAQSVK